MPVVIDHNLIKLHYLKTLHFKLLNLSIWGFFMDFVSFVPVLIIITISLHHFAQIVTYWLYIKGQDSFK